MIVYYMIGFIDYLSYEWEPSVFLSVAIDGTEGEPLAGLERHPRSDGLSLREGRHRVALIPVSLCV